MQPASSPFPDNAAKFQRTHFVISTFMSPAEALSLTSNQAIPHLGGSQGPEEGVRAEERERKVLHKGKSMCRKAHKTNVPKTA